MGERQACAPGPPWAPYNGVLRPHVSQSSFFGKVPRVKYAGFTRQVPHPLQAGIMSSNALTILPFAYWAPRTKVDLPRDGAQCRGCFQFGRRFHGSVSSAASVKTAEGLHLHAAASRSSVTRRRML
jgi:hypothetical protein